MLFSAESLPFTHPIKNVATTSKALRGVPPKREAAVGLT